MTLLKPKKLNIGDTMGIIAPSLPLFDDAKQFYDQSKTCLVEMGFRLVEGETIGLTHRWSAGTAEQQAADINKMYANPDVKAIIAHTGGFSSMSVIDQIDYTQILKTPKPFIGLSDITVYHWAMFAKTGLVGFHGNDLTFGFGQYFWNESAENKAIFSDLYTRLLTSTDRLGPIPFSDEWEIWRSGTADGPLIGGNFKRFMLLAGTDYFPSLKTFDGAILFWEDIGESWYDLAIYMQKLRHMGIFDRIGGFVIGQPVWINSYFDQVEHPTLQELVMEIVADYDFPVISNVKFGHHTCSVPLPIGCTAMLDTALPQLVITEAAVC